MGAKLYCENIDSTNRYKFKACVDSVQRLGGGSRTDLGLQLARETMQKDCQDNPGRTQVAVLVGDGTLGNKGRQNQVERSLQEAQSIQENNDCQNYIITIGVGSS